MRARNIISCYAIYRLTKSRKSKKRWTKEWLNRHKGSLSKQGILNDLYLFDENYVKNYLRMELTDFRIILSLIKDEIDTQNTVMREAIPSYMKLATTLRYLATG